MTPGKNTRAAPVGGCTTCEHFVGRWKECRELVGLLKCGKCGNHYRAESVDAARCVTCHVYPSPAWEIADPTNPPDHCPGWSAIPTPEPPAPKPKPTRGRKRKPTPQMELF